MRISDWSSDVCSFRSVGVRNPPVARVHDRVLHEGHADAADHAADALAAGRLRIDDTADPIGADDAPHARLPEIRVDGNFHEHGPEGVHREPLRRSEEHTSELQSLMRSSYAVFCLKKK